MDDREKRVREKTLKRFTEKLTRKYSSFLRAQLSGNKDKIGKKKNELNLFIMLVVQLSVALSEKYFKWYWKKEKKEKVSADDIFVFFTTVNGNSEAKKFKRKWDKKIWREIRGPKNKKRATEEFGEKNICILHLVISYMHQKIIKI